MGHEDSKETQQLVEKDEAGWWGARHTLAMLGFFGFANAYAMRVNLSVAIVAMVNQTAIPKINSTSEDVCPEPPADNSTSILTREGEFKWDEYQQGIILGSFFWGYIVTQIPGGRLAELFGSRKLLGYGILITSVLTLVTPLAARTSDITLIICRVLMGLGEGVTFPAMHALLAKWAPPLERSKLTTYTYAGSQFGTVVALPVSGILCEHGFDGGWPTVFYFFGTLGIIWFCFWMAFVADSPEEHSSISAKERNYILQSLPHRETNSVSTRVPWCSMLSSLPVWAVIVAHVGQNWGFYTLLTELPSYMNNILHFNLKQNSFLSALPYLCMWLFSFVCCSVADGLLSRDVLSPGVVRKIFNSIGKYGPALALIGAAFSGCSPVAAVTLLTFAVGLSGACYSGFQVNHVELAPQYAGTLFGITNCLANVCGFAAPYLVGSLVQGQQTLGQWRLVFFIAAGVYVFTNTFFLIFGRSRVEPWAQAGLREEEVVNILRSDLLDLSLPPPA